ncbi:dihydrodiol dehydrogenase [Diaphorobacter sp. LR2014-1]|uniref:dihydrodiol dehydrogenase n=1 Tax=Diaphorobacter sp. LR2014-1 TaxID=1933219 RepID=UPI000CDAFE0F|nr:dihydrodiol dehydrogenase [Diaphorobacter sp. LR2014-1]POR05985.1 dihydrodiol dehydrogenase [Diaphorobacter sp. LR2014-1]
MTDERETIVGNEFTLVKIRKVYTRNGERLEIYSPKLKRSIQLDPLALESLTWQDPEVFTKFLAKPFGT